MPLGPPFERGSGKASQAMIREVRRPAKAEQNHERRVRGRGVSAVLGTTQEDKEQ